MKTVSHLNGCTTLWQDNQLTPFPLLAPTPTPGCHGSKQPFRTNETLPENYPFILFAFLPSFTFPAFGIVNTLCLKHL
jgi:hypothetical protein